MSNIFGYNPFYQEEKAVETKPENLNEEVEQDDELSLKTKEKYHVAASKDKDEAKRKAAFHGAVNDNSSHPLAREKSMTAFMKAHARMKKRSKGMDAAVKSAAIEGPEADHKYR